MDGLGAEPDGRVDDQHACQSRVVMRIAKPGPFHNGGGLAFGPDGYMYISLGDGGGGGQNGGNDGGNDFNANQGHTNPGNPDTTGGWTGQGNAQDRRNVYGKILRIKPTIDADPNTNPNTVRRRLSYSQRQSLHGRIERDHARPRLAKIGSTRFTPTASAIRSASASTRDPTKLYAADVGPGPQHDFARRGEP